MGVVVYADDVLILTPTRGAMQMMLDECQEYATEHNIMFSTDPNPNQKAKQNVSLFVVQRRIWSSLLLSPCVGQSCPGSLLQPT